MFLYALGANKRVIYKSCKKKKEKKNARIVSVTCIIILRDGVVIRTNRKNRRKKKPFFGNAKIRYDRAIRSASRASPRPDRHPHRPGVPVLTRRRGLTSASAFRCRVNVRDPRVSGPPPGASPNDGWGGGARSS